VSDDFEKSNEDVQSRRSLEDAPVRGRDRVNQGAAQPEPLLAAAHCSPLASPAVVAGPPDEVQATQINSGLIIGA
jgi:hypothetical protein